MRPIVFELCAESIDACLAAKPGGAARIELCSGLSEGGLTPSHGLLAQAISHSELPVHVLIRPRGGDFCYTAAEHQVMLDDLRHARDLGAAGVVLGVLRPNATVDTDRVAALIQAARPMQITFHRAFDDTASLPDALEAIIALGCDRVLTSGGQQDVLAGVDMLRSLVQQAAGRIDIAVGGGLRLQNATEIAQHTGATHFHGSLRRRAQSGYVVDAAAIQAIIEHLRVA